MVSTATLVTSSAASSVFGQAVTFTATVAPLSPASGTPTGTVGFLVDGTAVSASRLLGGVASVGISGLGAGSHTVVARYRGDDDFGSSTGTIAHTVVRASTTTSLATPRSSGFAEPVTFTATVAPVPPGAGTPTGTVVFDVGGAGGGTYTGTLDRDGTATVTVGGLAPGAHLVTASYGRNADFQPSVGADTHIVAALLRTTTAVSSSPDPSPFGEPVAFTASVASASPAHGTPDGTVTFVVDGAGGGTHTGTLDRDGTATVTVDGLQPGVHIVTATYDGNPFHSGSTSMNMHVVHRAATVTGVVGPHRSSTAGQPVSAAAAVAALPSRAGTPAGTVAFDFGDGAPALLAPLVGGVALSPPHTYTRAGDHTITATYRGSADHAGSHGTAPHTVYAAGAAAAAGKAPGSVPSPVGPEASAAASGTAAPTTPAPTAPHRTPPAGHHAPAGGSRALRGAGGRAGD